MATVFERFRTRPLLNTNDTKSRFCGYVVIVTGGCSGIGRATVERFANDGATVYALDIRIQHEADLVSKYSGRVQCIQLDVTETLKCQQVVADIAKRHDGIIHTLVNSVAYFGSKGLDATEEDWEKSFRVNVQGYANMVQAVCAYMKVGFGCSIVNLSSISAHKCQPNRWTYSATKGAVDALTRCMALDLAENDIRVNSVSPSWIWSPEVSKAAGPDRASGESQWKHFSLVQRLGEVEEVAAAITFLASKDASYITATDLPVCGGYLAMGPEQHGKQSKFAGSMY